MLLCFYLKSCIISSNCKILKKYKDDDHHILNKSLERDHKKSLIIELEKFFFFLPRNIGFLVICKEYLCLDYEN